MCGPGAAIARDGDSTPTVEVGRRALDASSVTVPRPSQYQYGGEYHHDLLLPRLTLESLEQHGTSPDMVLSAVPQEQGRGHSMRTGDGDSQITEKRK